MSVVTFNGTRLTDGSTNVGYSKLNSGGGSPASEAQLAYRKPTVVNVKSTSSGFAGLQYAHASTIDMTAANRPLVFVKGQISDAGDVNAIEGCAQYIGSASGAYYRYNLAGSGANNDAYTAGYQSQGGLATNYVITCINPNISQWREATVGSPALTAIDYLAFVGSWVLGGAKAENLAFGPIDIGVGLDYNGTLFSFKDGVDTDQGNTSNRWGAACTNGPNIALRGLHRLGPTLATSGDDESSVNFPDGYHGTGDCGIEHNTTLCSSGLNGKYEGLGKIYGSDDTRPNLSFTGDDTLSVTHSGEFINFNDATLRSSQTFTGSIQCKTLTQAGATLTGFTLKCDSALNVAVCSDFTLADVTDFIAEQTGLGHFVDLGTIAATTSIEWTVKLVNFLVGTSGSPVTTTSTGAEAIIVNVASGQTLTINVASGATIPSVRNTGAGSVNIVTGQSTITFNVSFEGTNPANYEWRLGIDDPTAGRLYTTELDGAESETSLIVSYTYSYTSDTDIVFQIIADGFVEELFYGTLIDGNQNFNINVSVDEN